MARVIRTTLSRRVQGEAPPSRMYHRGMRWLVVVGVALVACGGTRERPVAPPKDETIAPEACAAELRARYAIDITPEPRACVPLFEALASLPQAQHLAHGLVIVRDHRGYCGETCPDLASAIYSDAQQASYSVPRHELHLTDAAFTGSRWRSGPPSHERVQAYLAELGIDWRGFVERVRRMPGVVLPPGELPEADVRVFEAFVQVAPRVMLGGETSLADLLRHEMGHMIQLRGFGMYGHLAWSRLTGWVFAKSGDPAQPFLPSYTPEQAIVGSRLALGLPRGQGEYRPTRAGAPTPYAQFDPWEDFAESVRLAYRDPRALARTSAVRLFVAGTPASLRFPEVRALIVPTLTLLLADEGCPLSLAAVRTLGAALLPEAAPLADPRPLPVPADVTDRERKRVDEGQCTATVGAYTFRPTDQAFAAFFAEQRSDLRALDQVCGGPCPE